jgi:hypothetical protein
MFSPLGLRPQGSFLGINFQVPISETICEPISATILEMDLVAFMVSEGTRN